MLLEVEGGATTPQCVGHIASRLEPQEPDQLGVTCARFFGPVFGVGAGQVLTSPDGGQKAGSLGDCRLMFWIQAPPSSPVDCCRALPNVGR